jgi:hypothetical protein
MDEEEAEINPHWLNVPIHTNLNSSYFQVESPVGQNNS